MNLCNVVQVLQIVFKIYFSTPNMCIWITAPNAASQILEQNWVAIFQLYPDDIFYNAEKDDICSLSYSFS